jgi:hypothetical protein
VASPAINTKATNSNSTMCKIRSLCDMLFSLFFSVGLLSRFNAGNNIDYVDNKKIVTITIGDDR